MENSHIVARFDKDMDRLRKRILEMGVLVESQIEDATNALDVFDAAKVDHLVATDLIINGMHKEIHTLAERVIALRQPVALDLRQALLPIHIAQQLERIGDHAKSTAKRARKIADVPQDQALMPVIQDMSRQVQSMLVDVLRAYADGDIDLAAEIRARDPLVDTLNKGLFKAAIQEIADHPDTAEASVHTILLARGFERVGDHIVNIARHVHQIATGEDLKASQ